MAQCWRLETSFRLFYYFIKMTLYRDLAIFKSQHLPFLNASYSPFQKNETLKSSHNWLLSNWSRLLNWKRPWNLALVLKIVQTIPKNCCPCIYLSISQVWWLIWWLNWWSTELWFERYIQKCTLPYVLILIMTQIMGLLKINKLLYLENGA